MAKISTYPNVGTPVLSDMLIGTDVTDSNATKNFMISDILGLIGSLGVYVPYVGATADVNLGSFNLYTATVNTQDLNLTGILYDSVGSPGTLGYILSSTGIGTQWISLSSLSLNLQQVLDDGNTADQNIIFTGASNKIEQTGSNAFIKQTGSTSYIQQTGATAFISQSGANASFIQAGLNALIQQGGNDAIFNQQGSDASFVQAGLNALIQQVGNNAIFDQQGSNASFYQQGASAIIEQIGGSSLIQQGGIGAAFKQLGDNAYIQQTGANANFSQSGLNAYIRQDGANAYIVQTGTTPYIEQLGTLGYIKPAQIKDSLNSFGLAGQVLTSLGPNLGVEWQDKNQIGSFFDSTNQTTAANVAAAMKFGTNDIVGYGVSVTTDGGGNKTQIVASVKGIYNVQFSAQLRNGAGASTVDIWFRLNGANIANSNTSVSLQANTNEVASWNYFVDLNPTDIFQIMWTQDNAAQLSAAAAAAPHPATPSTILTVNRVR